MLKKVLIGLLIIFVAIQFIRPAKNNSNDLSHDISKVYEVPGEVDHLLKVSCNDCHSNKTVYPWYAEIQPVGWWLDNHIEVGKGHLNFSEFTKLPIAIQNHKFEETIEMVEEKAMPLEDYTYFGLHPEADLSEQDRKLIIDWAKAQMQYLENTYPADSLVMPKRR
ncbi:MAG: heme-binding domain-containing protein [Flavobacteriaceae bacterium]|nr:heme-binding domain-containing protein [Flavobacteriaceae bacterium]